MPSANRRAPPEIPDVSASNWNNVRGAVHRFMRWARDSYSGLPADHQLTHLQTGPDALQAPGVPITSDPNLGADAGDGPSYALEDHRHDVELHGTNKGDLLVYNGSDYVALPAGEDGQLLTANSGASAGLEWTSRGEDLEYLAWAL